AWQRYAARTRLRAPRRTNWLRYGRLPGRESQWSPTDGQYPTPLHRCRHERCGGGLCQEHRKPGTVVERGRVRFGERAEGRWSPDTVSFPGQPGEGGLSCQATAGALVLRANAYGTV